MKKQWRAILAVLLSVVLVFAFASMAVACDGTAAPPQPGSGQESGTENEGDNPGGETGNEDNPGGIEDMTMQERYEALCAAVDAANGNYTLTIAVVNRAETSKLDISIHIADGKMTAEMESEYTSQGDTSTTAVTSYGLRQGDYFYEKTVIGTQSQTNVSYGESVFEKIPAVLDSVLSRVLGVYRVSGFYERMLGTASVGEDAVTFAFAEYMVRRPRRVDRTPKRTAPDRFHVPGHTEHGI